MTITSIQFEQLAKLIVEASEDSGNAPQQSVKIAADLQLGLAAVLPVLPWQQFSEISACAKQILAVAYPKFAAILTQDLGLEPASGGSLDIDRDGCIQILLIKVLSGIESFETSELKRAGAKELASTIPSPLPEPTTPFDDLDPYMTFE